jgi:hypothetical protein
MHRWTWWLKLAHKADRIVHVPAECRPEVDVDAVFVTFFQYLPELAVEGGRSLPVYVHSECVALGVVHAIVRTCRLHRGVVGNSRERPQQVSLEVVCIRVELL